MSREKTAGETGALLEEETVRSWYVGLIVVIIG